MYIPCLRRGEPLQHPVQQSTEQDDRSGRLVRLGAFVISTLATAVFLQFRVEYLTMQCQRCKAFTVFGKMLITRQAASLFTIAAIGSAIVAAFFLFSLYKDIRPFFRTILPLE